MHKTVSDNLVAVSEQIVSPSKSSLSHNHEAQAMIIFKGWKVTLPILSHPLIKTTEEKITKPGIPISYSGPVSSLEAAESPSDLKKALSLKLLFSRQLGRFGQKALPLPTVQDQELRHFTE